MRSAGRALRKMGCRFQRHRIQITATNDAELSAKTHPAPVSARRNAATIRPPSAGPTARAMLLLAAFSVTAGGIWSIGTSSGTIACHAGLFIAEPTFKRKVKKSRVYGETTPAKVRTARIATETSIHDCQKISNRLRS